MTPLMINEKISKEWLHTEKNIFTQLDEVQKIVVKALLTSQEQYIRQLEDYLNKINNHT